MDLHYLIIILVCTLSSLIGSICGIGGGVIIKPVLDSMQIMGIASISFLSGVTVLTMTMYSVGRLFASGESKIDLKIGFPLSLGAVAGGLIGKQLFDCLQTLSSNADKVGAYQAGVLFLLTFSTLIYTWKKYNIRTHNSANIMLCIFIGLALGLLSSFLGIGGGPFNLMFLSYFFSMETKKAAQNSLFIILFSQLASLIMTLFTNQVPPFTLPLLIYGVLSALLGASLGHYLNNKISNTTVDRLFSCLLIVILCICVHNFFLYI